METTTEVPVKTCYSCKQDKTLDNFYKDKNRPDGLAPACKHCMQDYARKRRASGQERQVQREWRKAQRQNPDGRYRAGRLIQEAKKRAECTITLDWLSTKIASGVCEVTGLPLDLGGHGAPARPFAPSIDRVDPTKGYTPDNVKVVVWIYNRAKGVHTHEDVMILAKALIANDNNKQTTPST